MNKLGVLISFSETTDILAEMQKAKDIGCQCCQLSIWNTALYTDQRAQEVREACEKTGLEVSTVWAGWSGPKEWNFTAGPVTLGVVPEAYRMKRAEEVLMGADFAAKIGVSRVATHAGFLPENPNDPQYGGVVAILRHIAKNCKKKGVNLLFETGQETPVTLLRVIEELGYDNVGINMDTANLILYGKANSADAITVFGKYVMDTHIKDGLYPTDGKSLGKEVPVGEGMANLPEVIRRLKQVGYTGNYIIEREITGEQQTKDIIKALELLKSILKSEE